MSGDSETTASEVSELYGVVELHNHNIWNAERGLIVIPVNCVGAMGAGLAKQCRDRYPFVYDEYRKLCRAGEFRITTMKIYEIDDKRAVLLMPTKMHWKKPSKPYWVSTNLERLGSCLDRSKYDQIHMPAVGCGLGNYDVENGWGATPLDVEVCLDWVRSYLVHPKVQTYFYHPIKRKRTQ